MLDTTIILSADNTSDRKRALNEATTVDSVDGVLTPVTTDAVNPRTPCLSRFVRGDNSPGSRVDVLRAIYAEQLSWYHAFSVALDQEANAINCYGMTTFTQAINRTIRSLKHEMGLPVQPDRTLPRLSEDSDA